MIRKYIEKLVAFLVLIMLLGSSLAEQDVYAADSFNRPRLALINKKTVQFDIEFDSVPKVENDIIYLYELQPFEYNALPEMDPVLKLKVKKKYSIKYDFEKDMLYKKYVLAGYRDGRLVNLCAPQYIVNPELLADDSKPRKKRKEFCTQTVGLGNIALTGNSKIVMTVNTMQVLNSRTNDVITHPLAREGVEDRFVPDSQYYYMLNAADEEGIKAITRELRWYAKNTAAQDFIIGNEVNNRMWNYMAFIPWEDYVREYVNLYRVCYNAIKSTNKNAKVYLSVEGDWNRDRAYDHWEYHHYIDAKDFLDKFNRKIKSEGNIDWGLSIHPYIVPVNYAKFWDYSEHPDGDFMVEQIEEQKMYSFQNMTMVTDYMLADNFRNPDGKVRDIIISEIGVDNGQGVDVQAAAICASYVAFKRNPYVTQYMYTDTAGYGVDLRLRGRAKKAFNAMGTKKEKEYLDWALDFIGAKRWEDVLDLYPKNYVAK